MPIITINRQPSWGDMAVGAVVNLPAALADPMLASGEAVPTPNATPTQAGPFTTTAGGGIVRLTGAQFAALEAGDGLTADLEYFCYDVPSRWIATSANTKDAVVFVHNGVTYEGDLAYAEATEKDLAAGTWATRPLTGFTTGLMYYRRMTDIANCTMWWLGGTSTEWRVVCPTWAVFDPATVAGAQSASAQVINPKDIPAGLLLAARAFRIHVAAGKSGTTDAMTSFAARLGTAGTTADVALLGPPSAAIAAGDRSRNAVHRYRWYDATHFRAVGAPTANGSDASTSTSGAADTEYTITGSQALKLSLGVVMATAAADTPHCAFLGLLLEP